RGGARWGGGVRRGGGDGGPGGGAGARGVGGGRGWARGGWWGGRGAGPPANGGGNGGGASPHPFNNDPGEDLRHHQCRGRADGGAGGRPRARRPLRREDPPLPCARAGPGARTPSPRAPDSRGRALWHTHPPRDR